MTRYDIYEQIAWDIELKTTLMENQIFWWDLIDNTEQL